MRINKAEEEMCPFWGRFAVLHESSLNDRMWAECCIPYQAKDCYGGRLRSAGGEGGAGSAGGARAPIGGEATISGLVGVVSVSVCQTVQS